MLLIVVCLGGENDKGLNFLILLLKFNSVWDNSPKDYASFLLAFILELSTGQDLECFWNNKENIYFSIRLK